ncbi:MAG: hypothetical protein WKF41_15865 [Gaiellaceae bacterium]
MRAVLAAVVASLVLAGTAAAHVGVTPGLLESGRETTLRIELPKLRPGSAPSALDVSGAGVRMLESSPTGRIGEESRWRVRVHVESEPGPLELALRVRYADGGSVTVRQGMTVLPKRAEASSSLPTLAVGGAMVALLVAIASVLLLLRRGRRGRADFKNESREAC